MKLRMIVSIVVHLLIALVGFGLAREYAPSLDEKSKGPATTRIEMAEFSEELRLSGIVEARDIRPVYAGVSGTVQWMIEEGTYVTPDTVIIKFDNADQVKQFDSKQQEFDQNKRSLVQQFRYAQRTKQLQRLQVVGALLDVEDNCIGRDIALGLPIGSSWREIREQLPPLPDFPLWEMQGGHAILQTLTEPVPVPDGHADLMSQGDAPVPELSDNIIGEKPDLSLYEPRYLADNLQGALDAVFASPQGQWAEQKSSLAMRQSEADRRWAAEDLKITVELQQKGLQSLAVLQAKQQTATAADLTAQRDEILDRLNLMGAADSTRRQVRFALLRQTLAYRKTVRDAEAEARKIDLDLLSVKLRVDASYIDLNKLKDNLDNADTKPPISGVVAYVDIWKGSNESLSPLQIGDQRNMFWDLCKIADTAQLRVRMVLDESDFNRVHIDQPAVVRLTSFPELALAGGVEEIQSYAEDRNAQLSGLALANRGEAFVRSFNVYVKLKDIPEAIHQRLRLGLSAEVGIQRGAPHQGLAVPPHAIDIDQQGQPVVYIQDPAESGGYRTQPVKVISRNPQVVEVLAVSGPPLTVGMELYFPASLPPH